MGAPASLHRAVVGVGSNVEPERHVAAAEALLGAEQRLLAASGWERTVALGPPGADGRPTASGQPAFLNGALLVETALDERGFRAYLRAAEARLGRRRGGDRWAPRTIDLDLVVWDGAIVDPDVHRRDFLARAVAAVCPEALGGPAND